MKIPTLLLLSVSLYTFATKHKKVPLTISIKNESSIACTCEVICSLPARTVMVDPEDNSFIRFEQLAIKSLEPKEERTFFFFYKRRNNNQPAVANLCAYPENAQEQAVKNSNLPCRGITRIHPYFVITDLDLTQLTPMQRKSYIYPIAVRKETPSLFHLCLYYINNNKDKAIFKNNNGLLKNKMLYKLLPEELKELLHTQSYERECVVFGAKKIKTVPDAVQELFEDTQTTRKRIVDSIKNFFKKDE